MLRLKFPAGFIVPPHRHSKDEFVTVISGRFAIASGEKLDRAAAQAAAAGELRPPPGRHAALRLGRRRDRRADQRHRPVRRGLRRSQGRSAQEIDDLRSRRPTRRPAEGGIALSRLPPFARGFRPPPGRRLNLPHAARHDPVDVTGNTLGHVHKESADGKFQSILETVGNTPVVRINRLAPAGRQPVRQDRGLQSAGLGQGSPGAGRDRGGRAVGRAQAGTDRDRGDQRQHRHRARHGVRRRRAIRWW